MNIKEILERFDGNTEKALEQAMKCNTPQELITLAGDYEIELAEEEAVRLLALINVKVKELTDDELDVVSGASDWKGSGCPRCGSFNILFKRITSQGECFDCGFKWFSSTMF